MDDVNQFIQEALANTGAGTAVGRPDATYPANTAPASPADTEGGSTTPGGPQGAPPPAADPYDEGFDYRTLPEEQQAPWKHFHGHYTRKRQQDAERIREIEARGSQYEGVPEEALAIARDYAARMSQGDIHGARALLQQQQAALDMLAGQYGGNAYGVPADGQGYPASPYGGQQGAYPPQNGYGDYEAPDPVVQRLDQLEQQNRMWQVTQEFQQFQHRLGRPVSPLEQQRMLSMKQTAPNLSFDQIHYLTHREEREREIVTRVQQEMARRMQAGSGALPPPSGVPSRAPTNPAAPSDRASVIAEAVAAAMRGG